MATKVWLFCTGKKRLAGILRETTRGTYPKFDERIRQGLAAKGGGSVTGEPALIPMRFSDGTCVFRFRQRLGNGYIIDKNGNVNQDNGGGE